MSRRGGVKKAKDNGGNAVRIVETRDPQRGSVIETLDESRYETSLIRPFPKRRGLTIGQADCKRRFEQLDPRGREMAVVGKWLPRRQVPIVTQGSLVDASAHLQIELAFSRPVAIRRPSDTARPGGSKHVKRSQSFAALKNVRHANQIFVPPRNVRGGSSH